MAEVLLELHRYV
uniref:Uncharacterized protein n=1 Tax=Anguilla anguilla TaxID=7936 RepID=A0A0E9TIQ6_ANGAN